MTTFNEPGVRPNNPNFSSGPCAKRPGWTVEVLSNAPVGRSHRAKIGKSKLAQAIELTREVLEVPADYRIGIVPAQGIAQPLEDMLRMQILFQKRVKA